ncbi:hypothetical protein HDV02_000023 [Globomyces sp. JEL0801]|nr:hypothetical protein HDV02_000023 [Globomyces sp. JEL0801]
MNNWSPICPDTFVRPEHRTRYQAIHTGHKPHICPHCGRACTRQESLRRHSPIYEPAIPWNRDSLMDYCRRYIASTHSITPPLRFPLARISSMDVEDQGQPIKSNQSKRNQVMSINYLIS